MFRNIFKRRESLDANDKINTTEKTKLILKQAENFEVALMAMDYVLDDRAQEGLKLLTDNSEQGDKNDETINVLAKGVIEFLAATLSFEAKEMKIASETLAKAEQLSLKSKARAEKENIKSSSYYPPGTVYAVTYTESTLLHALLMLFNESMIDAAKAVLKLRKAYYTLQEILESVKKVDQAIANNNDNSQTFYKNKDAQHNINKNNNNNNSNSSASFISLSGKQFVSVDIPYKLSPEEQKNSELLANAELIHNMRVRRLSGTHIDNIPAINRLRTELGIQSISEQSASTASSTSTTNNSSDVSSSVKITNSDEPVLLLSEDLDAYQATIDEFIHSGVNLCFGILQVVLSLLPPAIGAVLSIIGFKGSREDGLRLVWKSTKQRNVHGCIGLLALMFYYDGPFQFTDADFDIPATPTSSLNSTTTTSSFSTASSSHSSNNLSVSPRSKSRSNSRSSSLSESMSTLKLNGKEEMDAPTLLHPGKILENALLQARALFPNSALWLLNEARMLSGKGRLKEAVALMDSIDVNKIQMRQVKVLMIFDRAITLVHLHEFDRAAEDLISLVDISDWSHALYTYFAGCCYLENWRMCQMGLLDETNSKGMKWYEEKARELIFSAPNYLGKKTFKSKNLPLDRFMLRKVEQFKSLQKQLGVDNPLDAIATSPVHELAYFYNGYNRMTKDGLELTMKMLTEYENPAIELRDPDQELIKDLLTSLTMRRLGKIKEGCEILDERVLPKILTIDPNNGKVKYFKKTEDPWAYPTALYERALFCWKLNEMSGLQECNEWLTRAQNYADDYELSTRIGMKIKAALDRVENSLQ